MTAARVQEVGSQGTAGSQGSVVITLSGITTTVGNHLILCVSTNSVFVLGSFVVSDSKGNTWQNDEVRASSGGTAFIASCKLGTALVNGDTITVDWHLAGTCTGAATVAEYSGLATTSWLDKTAISSGASATASDSGATGTTNQTAELLIGAMAPAGFITGFTPESLSPAWTANTSAVPSSGNIRGVYPMFRVISAAAAYSAKATWTTGRPWAQIIATYRADQAVAVAVGVDLTLDAALRNVVGSTLPLDAILRNVVGSTASPDAAIANLTGTALGIDAALRQVAAVGLVVDAGVRALARADLEIDAPLADQVGTDLGIDYEIEAGAGTQLTIDAAIATAAETVQDRGDGPGAARRRYVVINQPKPVFRPVGTSLTIDAPILGSAKVELSISAPIARKVRVDMGVAAAIRNTLSTKTIIDSQIIDFYDTNKHILLAEIDEDLAQVA